MEQYIKEGLCPLCHFSTHSGKCPRWSSVAWWCARCLTTKIPPTDLAGPRLPNDILVSLNIGRGTKFCHLCSVPMCNEHATNKQMPRCTHECRLHTPAEEKHLVLTLDKYVPDWRTAGPKRCEVCNLPRYRYSLCRRHFEKLSRNPTAKLTPKRTYRIPTEPMAQTVIHVSAARLDSVRRIVQEEGGSVSAYVDELIARDLLRRTNAVRKAAGKQEKKSI